MGAATPIDLGTATIADLSAAIAAGTVTPSDLTEAALARIDALDPAVHAWRCLDTDDVRAQAQALTAEAQSGRVRGPLHGIPIGVKEQFHVAGMTTLMAQDTGVRSEDATAVAKLRAAGAVVMGKTHMAMFYGAKPPTRNPWNLAHTAGGTSSGSGAAVGARMVPLALGEQTGGSNLRPAAFCGVDGLVPTFGHIGRGGLTPLCFSSDHVGLIGLTMQDIALAFSLTAGPDPRDPTSLPDAPPSGSLEVERMRPPRIGVVRNFFPKRTEPVMLDAIESAATRLRDAGAEVSDILLPADFEVVLLVNKLVFAAEGHTVRSAQLSSTKATPTSNDFVGGLVPASYYLQGQRIRRMLSFQTTAAFVDLDALLMAATPGGAPEGDNLGDASLLTPWSSLGYPAITINGGLSAEGLPLGLQFVAAPMQDYTLLRVGAWCEGVLGRLPSPVVDVVR